MKKTIRTFRCWDYPDFFRQLPGYNREQPNNSGQWKDKTFIAEEDGECDYAVVFNRVGKEPRQAKCPKENVWQIVQEPYVYRIHDWMIDDQQQYSKVFTHYNPDDNPKYVQSYPILAWYVDRTYDELCSMSMPEKTRTLSWVTSNKHLFPGHRDRLNFIDFMLSSDVEFDLFGSGIKFIEDKWDGLAPYRYSLVVENTIVNDYWTEKLTDSFLSWTLPIYCGCPNIADYFPEDAYISIDIQKPEEALQIIKQAIENDEWSRRLDAIKEARDLVLNKYNLFAHISDLIDEEECRPLSASTDQQLLPYERTHKQRIKNKWLQLKSALKIEPLIK